MEENKIKKEEKINIAIGIGEIKNISMTEVEKKLILGRVYNAPLRAHPLQSPFKIYSFVTKLPKNAYDFAVKYSSPIIQAGVVKPIRGAYTFLTMDLKEIDKKFEKKKAVKTDN